MMTLMDRHFLEELTVERERGGTSKGSSLLLLRLSQEQIRMILMLSHLSPSQCKIELRSISVYARSTLPKTYRN